MKSLSLYEDKGSYLNKMDPFVKVIYVIAAILVPSISGNNWVYGACILLSAVLLAAAGILKRAVPVVGVSGIVLVTIIVIQGMFYSANETVVFAVGPAVFYKEGLMYSLGILLNVLVILLAICVLVFTTKPSDLIECLVEKGLSPRIGYVIVSIFQLIPQMSNTMGTITDAQRSRGMEVEGSLLVRIKAFLPLLSPVVMSSLNDTKERAVALEVRGFNAKKQKVFLNERKIKTSDRVIEVVLVAAVAVTIVWRVMTWLG